jgi:hypothetical protein
MIRPDVAAFVLSGLLCLATAIRGEELSVLPPELEEGPARQMVTRHLKRLAYEALERRDRQLSVISGQ